MDLDTLLHRYFATDDLSSLHDEAMARGREQLAIDFGVETEPGRRFALWVLMEALGFAPPPAEAFDKHPALRDAAYDWMRHSDRLGRSAGDA